MSPETLPPPFSSMEQVPLSRCYKCEARTWVCSQRPILYPAQGSPSLLPVLQGRVHTWASMRKEPQGPAKPGVAQEQEAQEGEGRDVG